MTSHRGGPKLVAGLQWPSSCPTAESRHAQVPKPFLPPPHQVSTSILWFATHSAAPLLPTQTSKFGVVVFFLQGDVALGCREMAGVGLATVPLPKQCSRFRSAVCMFIKAKCS